MIFQFILDAILATVTAIFTVLPSAPALPSAISTAGTWVVTQVSNSIAFLNMIYGTTLLAAIIVVAIGIFTFEWIYHTVMWIIHKVPLIGVD